jgi:hypothetical protein
LSPFPQLQTHDRANGSEALQKVPRGCYRVTQRDRSLDRAQRNPRHLPRNNRTTAIGARNGSSHQAHMRVTFIMRPSRRRFDAAAPRCHHRSASSLAATRAPREKRRDRSNRSAALTGAEAPGRAAEGPDGRGSGCCQRPRHVSRVKKARSVFLHPDESYGTQAPFHGVWCSSTLAEAGSDLRQVCLAWLCCAFRFSQPLDALIPPATFQPCFMPVAPLSFRFQRFSLPGSGPRLSASPSLRAVLVIGTLTCQDGNVPTCDLKGFRTRRVRSDRAGVIR